MKTLKKIKIAVFILFSIIISFTNCGSVLGLGIGSIIDSNTPNIIYVSRIDTHKLIPNQEISIILKNGTWINGRYIGSGKLSPEIFIQQYVKFNKSNDSVVRFPKIGENITILTNTGQNINLQFVGFDIITNESGRVEFIIPQAGLNRSISLNNAKSIKLENNNLISNEEIERLLLNGELPVLTSLRVNTSYGITDIALNDINIIQFTKKKNGKTGGFLIGLAIDIMWIISINNSLR